ncbi:CHAT domain-containing tetratricopeptide repeat protein [Planctomicrobium sp. SH661]|uniref:CHAT domain-containing protein n=1 Tax=Planctomicrobium sp. SH661 TaxID=3448124 RepID=UPI003F5C299D
MNSILRFLVLMAVIATFTCSSDLCAQQKEPGDDVRMTLVQYRALMQRDLHRLRAYGAMARMDGPLAAAESRLALRKEQEVFGGDYQGSLETRKLLILCLLSNDETDEAIRMFPQESLLRKILRNSNDEVRTLRQFKRFFQVTIDVLLQSAGRTNEFSKAPLEILEEWHLLARELEILSLCPMIPQAVAKSKMTAGDLQGALPYARMAFQDFHEADFDPEKAMGDLMEIRETLCQVLDQTAALREQEGKWEESAELRQESLCVIELAGGNTDTARRALDRTRLIAGLDAEKRSQLQKADELREEMWRQVENFQIEVAQKIAAQTCEIYERILGNESVDFGLASRAMGYLNWRQRNYRPAFGQMVAATRVFLLTNGPEDELTRGVVTDAIVNFTQAAAIANPLEPIRNEFDSFHQLIASSYPENHPSLAAVQTAALHLENLEKLSLEQRQKLAALHPKQQERDQLRQAGKYAESEAIAKELWTQSRDLLGTRDHFVHQQLFALAMIQSEFEKFDESVSNYELLFQISDQAPFNLLAEFGDRFQWQAGLYFRLNQPDRAMKSVERGLQAMDAAQVRGTPSHAWLLQVQARIWHNAYAKPAIALPILQEVVEVLKKTRGATHLDTAFAVVELGECEMTLGRFADARGHLEEAMKIWSDSPDARPVTQIQSLNSLGRAYLKTGEFQLAQRSFREAIELQTKIHPQSKELAFIYSNLLQTSFYQQQPATSEKLVKEFLRSRERACKGQPLQAEKQMLLLTKDLTGDFWAAPDSPMSKAWEDSIEKVLSRAEKGFQDHASDSGSELIEIQVRRGVVKLGRGAPEKAMAFLNQARGLSVNTPDVPPSLIAQISANQSTAAAMLGDYSKAILYRREAIAAELARGQTAGLLVARNLIELGKLLSVTGDLDRAEDSLLQAEAIFKSSGLFIGSEHELILAEIYLQSGQFERAETYVQKNFRDAAETTSGNGKKLSPRLAVALAMIALARNDASHVMEIWERVRMEQEGDTDADRIRQLKLIVANALMRQGDFPAAKQHLEEILATFTEDTPRANKRIPLYLVLSELAERQHDDALALQYSRQAFQLAVDSSTEFSIALSERQQLLLREQTRPIVDRFLTLALRNNVDINEVYSVVLWWKGGVYRRQRFLKEQISLGDASIRSLAEELAAVNHQLSATAFLGVAKDSSDDKRISSLVAQQELLEGRLNGLIPESGIDADAILRQAEGLNRAIPDEAVLIDYLVYVPRQLVDEQATSGKEHLLAFVTQHDDPVRMFDLGLLSPISEEIHQWNHSIVQSNAKAFRESGNKIRSQLLTPLPQIPLEKAILVSPDGPLARVPFAALPTETQEKYLLEEHPLVIVPGPQELISPRRKTERPDEMPSAGLLLVGDVDFSESSSVKKPTPATTPAPLLAQTFRGGNNNQMSWNRLPGTRAEMESIGRIAQQLDEEVQVVQLSGSEATEDAFRRDAPQSRWLHLATHGFFATTESDSMHTHTTGTRSLDAAALGRERIAGFHPGMLSGVVMAGANSASTSDAADGILTALEMASLDLSGVEMAVLSACETGLGERTSGEGVLGLQRALQVAGCRSVVSSLWKVDDQATRILMEEFYSNLWKKKLSRQEALRQAQIAMLQRYNIAEGELRGIRRLRTDNDAGKFNRTPPVFWAAFTFSGDWE